jgi:3-hydroxybutyrate dehydrogenase
VRTPLVDKQIPSRPRARHLEADVIKNVMKDTVGSQFTTVDDVAGCVLFAGARGNALTGQSMVASHGWFMQWGRRWPLPPHSRGGRRGIRCA